MAAVILHLGSTTAAQINKLATDVRSVRRLLVAACVVPSSPIFVTLMKRRQVPPKRRFLQEPHGVTTQKTPFYQILSSSETSVLTRPTRRNFPEGIIQKKNIVDKEIFL
jgi:hypothetical protein